MEVKINRTRSLSFGSYFWQFLLVIPIAITLHYCQVAFINQSEFRYKEQPDLIESLETTDKQLSYQVAYIRREILNLREEIEEIRSWKLDFDENLDMKISKALDIFYSDQLGMFDYASEYSGGSIISTPDTLPYPSRYNLRLFGAFEWNIDSEPGVILQHNTFPGRCYVFYGNKGRIRVRLGRPVIITHVSLEHLRIGESLDSAPKDFQVLGFGTSSEQDLGSFVYDLNDNVIQTFRINSKNQTFRSVELRILSNYGNDESTCVYRFRVHSLNLNLK